MIHQILRFSSVPNVPLYQIYLRNFQIIKIIELALISVSSKSSNKKRKLSDVSGSDTESDTDQEYTLNEIAKLIRRKSRSNKKSINALADTMNEMKLAQEESISEQKDQKKELISLKKEVKSLKSQNPKELIFSGHLGSMIENTDLKALVIEVASFLGIPLHPSDIRNVRLLKSNKTLNTTAPGPAPIVATFYSSSHCLKILDAKKSLPKILNADVTADATSDRQIFITEMIDKDLYRLKLRCKTWAKANNHKFVWHGQGNILIKKDDNSAKIQISCESDLTKLSESLNPSENQQRPATLSTILQQPTLTVPI